LRYTEAIDPIQHPLRIVLRRAAVERVGNEAASAGDIAGLKRRNPLMKDGLRLPLQLGLRAARAVDIRTRAIVVPIEEQHARPEVDGLFVLTEEVLVEPGKEQLLDAGITLGCGQRLRSVRVGTERCVVNAEIIQGSGIRDQGSGTSDPWSLIPDPRSLRRQNL
jgi:hypothetical protein